MSRYIVLFCIFLSGNLFAAAPVLDVGVDTRAINNASRGIQKQAESNTAKTALFASFNYLKPLKNSVFTGFNIRTNSVNYKKNSYNDYWSWGATAKLSKKSLGFSAPLFEASLNYNQRHYDDYLYAVSDSYTAGLKISQRATDRLNWHVGMHYFYDDKLRTAYRYRQAIARSGTGLQFELGFDHRLALGTVYTKFAVAMQDEIVSINNNVGVLTPEYWQEALHYDMQLGYNLPITRALAADLLIEYSQASLNAQKDYAASSVSLALIYRFAL